MGSRMKAGNIGWVILHSCTRGVSVCMAAGMYALGSQSWGSNMRGGMPAVQWAGQFLMLLLLLLL